MRAVLDRLHQCSSVWLAEASRNSAPSSPSLVLSFSAQPGHLVITPHPCVVTRAQLEQSLRVSFVRSARPQPRRPHPPLRFLRNRYASPQLGCQGRSQGRRRWQRRCGAGPGLVHEQRGEAHGAEHVAAPFAGRSPVPARRRRQVPLHPYPTLVTNAKQHLRRKSNTKCAMSTTPFRRRLATKDDEEGEEERGGGRRWPC